MVKFSYSGTVLFIAMLLTSTAVLACENGAAVPDEYCKFFVRYTDEVGEVGSEVQRRLPPPNGFPKIRSYALIASVHTYPRLEDQASPELSNAAEDFKHLKEFFAKQEFEEIIALENQDVNEKNLKFFFTQYFVNQGQARSGQTRVVFAYSGHGVGEPTLPGSPARTPKVVLSNAVNGDDPENTIDLEELSVWMKKAGKESFQFVAFLASCYSGGIFPQVDTSQGFNFYFTQGRGAYAVSATSADDLAWGFKGHGSLFFDSLIDGVESGLADSQFANWYTFKDGSRALRGGGITRLGELTGHISGELQKLGVNPKTHRLFPQILQGSLLDTAYSRGAIFFVVPKRKLPPHNGEENALNDAANTGSAVVADPDVAVFNAPDTYQIRGVDVSHWQGQIRWPDVKSAGLRFAFIKATEGGSIRDRRFSENWSGAKDAGILRGAFHTINFCLPGDVQFENYAGLVPVSLPDLPMAIDIEWGKGGPLNPHQKVCGDVDRARETIRTFATLVEKKYGKRPILYSTSHGVKALLGGEFDKYALWLPDFTKDSLVSEPGPSFSGSNPWTFWQVGDRAKIAGLDRAGLDVFFGNEVQFEQFAEGKSNVALVVALSARDIHDFLKLGRSIVSTVAGKLKGPPL